MLPINIAMRVGQGIIFSQRQFMPANYIVLALFLIRKLRRNQILNLMASKWQYPDVSVCKNHVTPLSITVVIINRQYLLNQSCTRSSSFFSPLSRCSSRHSAPATTLLSKHFTHDLHFRNRLTWRQPIVSNVMCSTVFFNHYLFI